MAGGVIVSNGGGGRDYPGNLTLYVLFTCFVAATGGLIFGYDLGISGGVTSMDPFLMKFFPSVYWQEKADESTNQYCKFDSQLLTAFTSSLYLAALIASFFASSVTRVFGRKWSMLGGGVTFLAGAAINGAARNVLMLILGRILLGVGVGFANQSVPLYLSEMAPARLRGMLNIGFQLMITIGILCANLINYGTAKIKGGWGWRISLALAAIPGAIIAVGSLFLPDTPNSLIERGHADRAKRMLRRIRGTDDILDEFNDLVAASEESKLVKHPWANIVKRKYRPQLTMAVLIPRSSSSRHQRHHVLLSGALQDHRLRRRRLPHVVGDHRVGECVRHVGFHSDGDCGDANSEEVRVERGGGRGAVTGYAAVVVLFICLYVAGFAWSWGPLGWLVPSEIFPLEIRSAGQSINVSVNMLFTFGVAQAFLAMLCHLKYFLFFFFAGWVVLMTTFIALFLPETKNVPIEEMLLVWRAHWFWAASLLTTTTATSASPRQIQISSWVAPTTPEPRSRVALL
uniref:Major facilitator superfamily (MFS) profile domain-containing protein n=1 Tax=Ananas comosus var. bracteatus TaxID=296719 RepID=A0A6V7QDK4_ANACO|nr:unnamed protein product [Ananas comosus var. bracteatus]